MADKISTTSQAFTRLDNSIDRMFNEFQVKFLADAKLLLEKAFGKSIDFPVAISQSCEESDDSSVVVDFVEPKVQVSVTEVSTKVEFNDSSLEPLPVQGVASTELDETDQEMLSTDSKKLKVFDESSVRIDEFQVGADNDGAALVIAKNPMVTIATGKDSVIDISIDILNLKTRLVRFIHCQLVQGILVYVPNSGYMLYRAGVPRHTIIEMLAGELVSKPEDLISILCKLSRGACMVKIHSDSLRLMVYNKKVLEVNDPFKFRLLVMEYFSEEGVIVVPEYGLCIVRIKCESVGCNVPIFIGVDVTREPISVLLIINYLVSGLMVMEEVTCESVLDSNCLGVNFLLEIVFLGWTGTNQVAEINRLGEKQKPWEKKCECFYDVNLKDHSLIGNPSLIRTIEWKNLLIRTECWKESRGALSHEVFLKIYEENWMKHKLDCCGNIKMRLNNRPKSRSQELLCFESTSLLVFIASFKHCFVYGLKHNGVYALYHYLCAYTDIENSGDASLLLAEKQKHELDMKKESTEDLKEAMQPTMEGHARMLEQYADFRAIVYILSETFHDSVMPVLLQDVIFVRKNKARKTEEILGQFVETLTENVARLHYVEIWMREFQANMAVLENGARNLFALKVFELLGAIKPDCQLLEPSRLCPNNNPNLDVLSNKAFDPGGKTILDEAANIFSHGFNFDMNHKSTALLLVLKPNLIKRKRAMMNIWSNHLKKIRMASVGNRIITKAMLEWTDSFSDDSTWEVLICL